MSGFVSFVGSGPGDPELLTLKAVDRLKRADAVLYDDLSSGVLGHVPAEADLVSVGKRAGRASPRQDHVSRLLVDYAKVGGRIVRLKSGDSGVFGRLEEELVALEAAGIAFEIVPGVPSACAGAAAAGLPLTRRETARRLQFVTGHDVTGALPEALNMAALADPEATTVVYMGRRTFAKFAVQLMEYGLSPKTPAMIAEGVSGPDEAIEADTISALAERLAREDPSRAPTLIYYGALAPMRGGPVSDDKGARD